MSKSKYIRDDAERYHENNIDIANRRVYVPGEITDESAAEFIKNMQLLGGDTNTINIRINCVGGLELDAWGMYDAIRQCKGSVVGLVDGCCMSAAVNLLLACDLRQATEHSTFMLHIGEAEMAPQHKLNIYNAVDFTRDVIDEWSWKLYSKAMGVTKTKARKLFSFDVFYTAEQALQLGLIDEIVVNPEPTWLKEKK